ncbi:MAG TPA: archease [Planctomycetaceae bacterium]|nr:archease [Planctomycetaceae bacterium]
MYELFDHTADLGLRVHAPDLQTLLADAGRGLCAMLVDNPQEVRPSREETLRVPGSAGQPEYLLFDWLNALLHRFEAAGMLFTDFEVRLDETGLRATARGEPADPDRHQLAHEVKAITYHGLTCEPTSDGWRAEVIVDI